MKMIKVSLGFKQTISLVLQSVLGVVLLVIFVRNVDVSRFLYYISRVSLSLTCLAVVFYLAAACLRILRFRYLLQPLKKITLRDALTTSFAGALLNYLIPLRAGEVGRAWYLRRIYTISLISGTTVSFIDKLFDLFAIFFVVLFFSSYLGRFVSLYHISFLQVVFMLGLVVLVCLVIFKASWFLLLGRAVLMKFPASFRVRVFPLFERVAHGFLVLQVKPVEFLWFFLLSLAALFFDGLFVYFLYLAFGFGQSLFLVVLGYALFNFSFIIPAGPGYIGNIEFLGLLIFSTLLGMPKLVTVSVVIFLHILITVILAVTGFISLFLLHFRKRLRVA